jgi:primosomal protein N' (replication factor Y)
MFIIDCLPLRKGLKNESLSYFGSEYVESGSLLKVNLRGKNVPALVLECRKVEDAKAEIKTANFRLKKITSIDARPFLQKEFLEAVRDSADYFASSSGEILYHLIPSFVLENPSMLIDLSENKKTTDTKTSDLSDKKLKNEVAALQAPDEERLTHFRSLVREEFARKKSVFLCLPQNEDVREMKDKLSRGIESYVYAFHNDMSKKDLKKEWENSTTDPHPILILATAEWLFLPREDIGVIVAEKENENGWKTLSRPFLDLRLFAEKLAGRKKIKMILSDSFLRIETLYRYKQGDITEFESVKWRLPGETQTAVVDLREITKKAERGETVSSKEFKTLSSELCSSIKETIETGSHIFIFAGRKGISSVTICRDCGEQVKCNNCSSPMVLYRKPPSAGSGNVFRCHQCGEVRDAAETCQNCGSWKLAAFGAGLDKVADEIKKTFPGLKLFEIHKEATPTGIKAVGVAESFYATKGSVLLGTEMALSYLHKKVSATAIASFDFLFSIPDFRIREKIFRIILQVKNLSKGVFILQTRNTEDSTIVYALSGNLLEFYKKETEDRAPLGYPPFGMFIKVTARGNK